MGVIFISAFSVLKHRRLFRWNIEPTIANRKNPKTQWSLFKKWSFPLRISSVNVTKSAGNLNPVWKTSFFVHWVFCWILQRTLLFGAYVVQVGLEFWWWQSRDFFYFHYPLKYNWILTEKRTALIILLQSTPWTFFRYWPCC